MYGPKDLFDWKDDEFFNYRPVAGRNATASRSIFLQNTESIIFSELLQKTGIES